MTSADIKIRRKAKRYFPDVKSTAKKQAMVGKPITSGLKLNHSPSLWYTDRLGMSLPCSCFIIENHEFGRQKVEISNFYSNMFKIFIKRSNFCLYLSVIIRFLALIEIVITMTVKSG